uniref:Uncharacterized protein n=1 Tax=Setaria digitata TaxID=48799 RepID=A0A915PC67_9BILA
MQHKNPETTTATTVITTSGTATFGTTSPEYGIAVGGSFGRCREELVGRNGARKVPMVPDRVKEEQRTSPSLEPERP